MTEHQQDIIAKILLAIFMIAMAIFTMILMLLEWVIGKKFISEAR